jgi:phosphate transport system protein
MLQDEILILGSMVEQAVQEAVVALKHCNFEAAQHIYANDHLINAKRYEIENRCLVLIATQQPMAGDLRTLAAILEISTELERIGDYAKGISRIVLLMERKPVIKLPPDIPLIAKLGLDMLHRSLGTFIDGDATTARSIPSEDNLVDALYNQIQRYLLGIMLADSSFIENANYLLWVAHNLERLADRVTNICERVVFMVTGEVLELDHYYSEQTYVFNQLNQSAYTA